MVSIGYLLRAAYMAFAAFAIVVFFGKIHKDLPKLKRSSPQDIAFYIASCVGVGVALGVGFRVFSFLLVLFRIEQLFIVFTNSPGS